MRRLSLLVEVCLFFGLAISSTSLLLLPFGQYCQAWVNLLFTARTIAGIAIFPACAAETPAVFPAKVLHRKAESYCFHKGLGQVNPLGASNLIVFFPVPAAPVIEGLAKLRSQGFPDHF